MSRARGCWGPARSLTHPWSSRQEPYPQRRHGTRGHGTSGHWPSHASGNGFPCPRCSAGRWVHVLVHMGEMGASARSGLGQVQGLSSFTPSCLLSILPQCRSSQEGLSVSLPSSEPSSVVCSGGRGISPRGGKDGAGWYHAPPDCPCKGLCWSRGGGVTPPPSSRAWAGWALLSGLIGPPWCDTGAGFSVTTAQPCVIVRGNPAPLPTGSPFAARWVSFPALSHRKSPFMGRRDEAAQGCKASE